MGIWIEIALVIVLVLANAAFAGTEMALVSLRHGQLQRLESSGDTGVMLGRLVRNPNRFLATIQIGITLAGFLASATAAVSLAEPLVEPLAFLGDAAEPVAVLAVTLVLTFVTLVLGELAPKRIAMQRSERWALLATRPLTFLAKVSTPAIWLLGRSTDLAVRIMGGDPSRQREQVTEEEVRELVETQVPFTPQQRRIIAGAIEVADRHLREILIPRRGVVVVHATTSTADALGQLAGSGHSRAPVVDEDLDHVIGVVHLRDLVAAQGSAADAARPCSFLPETVGVLDALRHLQAERRQLAVVVNEYGGTEGIVTVEDLIEELVGEIYDETDRDIANVIRSPDGKLRLPGNFPIHDLVDIAVDLPEGEYTTVAGFILDRLGRIPKPGDTTSTDDWTITVLDVANRAIVAVQLSPIQRTSSSPPAKDTTTADGTGPAKL